MKKKILVVLTSVPKYPNLERATGLWLGEAVHFVKKVEEAGYEVDFVSPEGGYTPIDPHSLAMAEPVDWEWYQDKQFMSRLGATLRPRDINPENTELRNRGGHYQKATQPWAAFAIEDQRVITGQNPASGGGVADLLLKVLASRA